MEASSKNSMAQRRRGTHELLISVKEKQKRETLDSVLGEDGKIKTSEAAILGEVEKLYFDLYTLENCIEEMLKERQDYELYFQENQRRWNFFSGGDP